MVRLSIAVGLALACFASAPASADPPLRMRSAVIRSLESYDNATRQRELQQRRRRNELDAVYRQLENSRIRARRESQRRDGPTLVGERSRWTWRESSSVAAR